MIFIVIRNRKQREKEEIEERRKKMAKKPKKIEMNIPAAPISQTLPMNGAMAQDLPPVGPVHKVEETKVGSGYIRPKREKKKKASRPKKDIAPSVAPEPPVEDMFMAKEKPSPEPEAEKKVEKKHLKKKKEPVPEKEPVKKDDVNWDEDDGEIEEFEELEDLEEYEDLEEIEEMDDLDEIEEIEDWPEDDNIEEWG